MKTTQRDERFYDAVCEELASLRMAAGITQEQAAKAVGLSRISISNIEAGRTRPGLHLIRSLAQFYIKSDGYQEISPMRRMHTWTDLIHLAQAKVYKT